MPVFFGSVSIGQQGVSNSKELLPWTEISNVSLVGGKIRFNRKNPSLPSLDIPLSEIPDVCVFEALVAEILSGQR